jgi:hypothetical protein
MEIKPHSSVYLETSFVEVSIEHVEMHNLQ